MTPQAKEALMVAHNHLRNTRRILEEQFMCDFSEHEVRPIRELYENISQDENKLAIILADAEKTT